MSYVDVQDEIVALLKTIPNVKTYQGHTDDEVLIEVDSSADKIKPFNTISFGGMVDPGRNINGITGAKQDTHMVSIVVRSVANSDRDSQRLWQRVWNLLIGYRPQNSGEINAALYGGVGEISSLGNPTRYAAVQSYKFYINSDFGCGE